MYSEFGGLHLTRAVAKLLANMNLLLPQKRVPVHSVGLTAQLFCKFYQQKKQSKQKLWREPLGN